MQTIILSFLLPNNKIGEVVPINTVFGKISQSGSLIQDLCSDCCDFGILFS